MNFLRKTASLISTRSPKNAFLAVFVLLIAFAAVYHVAGEYTYIKNGGSIKRFTVENPEQQGLLGLDTSEEQGEVQSTDTQVTPTPDKNVGGAQDSRVTSTPTLVPVSPTGTSSAVVSTTPTQKPTPIVNTSELGHLPVLGDEKAKVSIVMFSDFQCAYCKSFMDEVFNQLKAEYIDTGKVKFAFIHFPLSIHTLAKPAAEAAECAHVQGNFWNYHDKLFSVQEEWSSMKDSDIQRTFESYASELGLDNEKFKSCVENHDYSGLVEADTAYGRSKNVNATPTFFINGKPLVGAQPFESFKAVIEEELSKSASSN